MRAVAVICLLPTLAVAQDDPAGAFCWAAETAHEARVQCVEDYEHAAVRILEYGKANGHMDADGNLEMSDLFSSLFSWRTLVGLPPDNVFLKCAAKGSEFAGEPDLREIWACIRERDPDAARMDAI